MIRKLTAALIGVSVILGAAAPALAQDGVVVIENDPVYEEEQTGRLQGYAETSFTILDYDLVGGSAQVKIGDSTAYTALDHALFGRDADRSFADFAAARAWLAGEEVQRPTVDPEVPTGDNEAAEEVADEADSQLGSHLRSPAYFSKQVTNSRDDHNTFKEESFRIPDTGLEFLYETAPIRDLSCTVTGLVGSKLGDYDVVDDTDTTNCVDQVAGESGTYLLGKGGLVDGLVDPARMTVSHDSSTGGLASAKSHIRDTELLSGFGRIHRAGAAEHTSEVTPDYAAAYTDELSFDDVELINLEGLLELLGYGLDLVPLPMLAQMVEATGAKIIDPHGTLAAVENFESWQHFAAAVARIQNTILEATNLGVTCDTLDTFLGDVEQDTESGNDIYTVADFRDDLKKTGLSQPECLGAVNALEDLLAGAEALESDLENAVFASAKDASILSVAEFSMSLEVVSSLDAQGDPFAAVDVIPGELVIQVGEDTLVHSNVAKAGGELDQDEGSVLGALQSLLGQLGDEFAHMIDLRIVPDWVEKVDIIDLKYAEASVDFAALMVSIDPPDQLPDLQEAYDAYVGQALAKTVDYLEENVDDVGETVEDLTGALAVASVRDADPAVTRGQVGPTAPTTITFGRLSATAGHARPGVTVKCVESCVNGKITTRTWDRATGTFGDPGSGTGLGRGGTLPRTGSALGNLPIAAAAALLALAALANRCSQRAPVPAPVRTRRSRGATASLRRERNPS